MDKLIEWGLDNALMATVLAVPAAVVSYGLRRPALRHGVWLLVLLKLVTPPMLPVRVPWPARTAGTPAEVVELPADRLVGLEPPRGRLADRDPWPMREEWPAAAAAGAPAEGPTETPARSPGWWLGRAVRVAWPVSALVWLGWLARQTWQFHRLQRYAQPAPAALRQRAERLARRMGLARCPPILTLPAAVSPMLWGMGRPRLLLPAGLLDRLAAGQQTALLAHELAHFKRRDHWVRVVELAATGLFWWHPVL